MGILMLYDLIWYWQNFKYALDVALVSNNPNECFYLFFILIAKWDMSFPDFWHADPDETIFNMINMNLMVVQRNYIHGIFHAFHQHSFSSKIIHFPRFSAFISSFSSPDITFITFRYITELHSSSILPLF